METKKKNKILKIFLIGLMALFAIIPFSLKLKDINQVNAQTPSPSDFTPYALTYTNNWTSYTAPFSFGSSGNFLWSDGSSIYYSYNAQQYVFDNSNNFVPMNWVLPADCLTSGRNVWSWNGHIFFSNGLDHFELGANNTWSAVSFSGLSNFDGAQIWTDGSDVYYCNGVTIYIFDGVNYSWSVFLVNNFSVQGNQIWSDNNGNIFYSNGNDQYQFLNGTFTPVTWNYPIPGFTNFYGVSVWTDGTYIYYNNASFNASFVLGSNFTWTTKNWTLDNASYNFTGARLYSLPEQHIVLIQDANFTYCVLDIDNSGGGTGGGEQTNTYYHYIGTNFNLLSYAYANSYRVGNVYFEIEDISSTNYTVSINYLMLNGYGDTNNTITYNVSSSLQTSSITGILGSISIESGTDFNSQVYNNQYPYYVYIHTLGWANSDIVGCSISTTLGTLSNGINISPYLNGVNIVTYVFRYFNSSNDSLFIELSGIYDSSLISSMPLQMINRTYYFDNSDTTSGNYQSGYNTGYSAGLSQGYNNGYNAGSNASYSTGYDAGLSQGYTNGYSAGDSAGYNRGVLEASDYSFLSLIGAVVDAPVTAFTSLLNFNVLGVNILNFLTGLLTLALCILVVKFIMGGWR